MCLCKREDFLWLCIFYDNLVKMLRNSVPVSSDGNSEEYLRMVHGLLETSTWMSIRKHLQSIPRTLSLFFFGTLKDLKVYKFNITVMYYPGYLCFFFSLIVLGRSIWGSSFLPPIGGNQILQPRLVVTAVVHKRTLYSSLHL